MLLFFVYNNMGSTFFKIEEINSVIKINIILLTIRIIISTQ